MRILWHAQESDESFVDWFRNHRGDGFERVAQAFTESLGEFLPEIDDSRPAKNQEPVDVRKEAYKIAGLLGLDCKSLSLRELLWMAQGKFPEVKDERPVNDGGSLSDLCVAMGGKIEG